MKVLFTLPFLTIDSETF